jgi:hypothetical protein
LVYELLETSELRPYGQHIGKGQLRFRGVLQIIRIAILAVQEPLISPDCY